MKQQDLATASGYWPLFRFNPAMRKVGERPFRLSRADFSRAVYAAEFGQGLPIADRAVIAALLVKRGLDAETVLARAESEANKAALKAKCARGRARNHRRAEPRDRGRRGLLGQRPAGAGSGLGGRKAP